MSRGPITAGLRIDVDTLRGTKFGVPNLLAILARRKIKATFFFSVGPDNMGRHLWRLLKPAFLIKMLRTRAAKLYGWDILFKGTFWPGPLIGKRGKEEIRAAARAGHEIGLHAWDHQRWQSSLPKMSLAAIKDEISRGRQVLEKITGRQADCAAAPAWRLTPAALQARESFRWRYLSDCRGTSIFYPQNKGMQYKTPQIPTTLPTYDEIIGGKGVNDGNYNDYLLSLFRPAALNILTVHAEVEGLGLSRMFDEFLAKAGKLNIIFQPLGVCLAHTDFITAAPLVQGTIPGREGWVAQQGEETVLKNDPT